MPGMYRHAMCLYPYPSDQRPGIGIFPPTGLEYVATALKDHVDRISLIDLRHEPTFQSVERLGRFVRNEGVDLVCVSLTWKARYRRICQTIAALPPQLTTVVGGHQATDEVEDVLARCPNVDLVVRGEGEETIVEIARRRPWPQILGVSYRDNGRIVHNANRPPLPLSQIQPPDRRLRRVCYVPVLRGRPLVDLEFDTVLSSRGCPYHCKFCTFSLNPLGQKRRYEARDPESVVEEIASSSARIIQFADDNFFVQPSRVFRICELLTERKIEKRYVANARLEIARNPALLEAAWRAGFRMLLLGIESASDRTLEQLDKGFTTAQIREAFTTLRRFPFWYHGYFIYGNPGETEQEMLAIAGFARELGVHAIGLSQLHLDRYTPLRKIVEETPGYTISPNGHVYSPQFDKRRLLTIRNRIRNRFWYRPSHVARIVRTLRRADLLSDRQLMDLAVRLPLLLWDYLAFRSRKAWAHFRDR